MDFDKFISKLNIGKNSYSKQSVIKYSIILNQKWIRIENNQRTSECNHQCTEVDFEELDQILSIICPNISYLKYKNIMRHISVTYHTEHDPEYVVQCEKKTLHISLIELYNLLYAENLL
jgi:hypothetical protein